MGAENWTQFLVRAAQPVLLATMPSFLLVTSPQRSLCRWPINSIWSTTELMMLCGNDHVSHQTIEGRHLVSLSVYSALMSGTWISGYRDKCLVRCLKWPRCSLGRPHILIFFISRQHELRPTWEGGSAANNCLVFLMKSCHLESKIMEKIFLYANTNLRTLCTLIWDWVSQVASWVAPPQIAFILHCSSTCIPIMAVAIFEINPTKVLKLDGGFINLLKII